ncbi:MAG: hypothetical protein H6704_15530 [Myxococcales bacterium]|nr:hypothetical protein [Myxococcales bacterium]
MRGALTRRPDGQHGVDDAQPFRVFDSDASMVNFTTRFLGTAGRVVTTRRAANGRPARGRR